MKLKLLCIMTALVLPFLTRAQGVITVFSEDGDKFYLVLNGIRQNQVAQTNVRVDGLTADFYNGKIIFEDGSKPEITKNLNTKDAGSGQYAEVTFKIKHTKDGELKLRYFGATPVPVSYNPPPDMYMVHYGQAAPPPPPAQQTTVTTTTTTTSGNMGGVNMNVGAGGVNMSVNMGDPNMGGNGNVNLNMNMGGNGTQQTTVSQTTTTSSSYSSSSGSSASGAMATNAPQGPGNGCGFPMSPGNFNSAKSSINGSSFDDTKLSTAKSVLASNCMSSDQVAQVCGLFSFEQSKLAFAKYAYSRTTDPSNFFKVVNVFNFESSKTDLNNFITNGGR